MVFGLLDKDGDKVITLAEFNAGKAALAKKTGASAKELKQVYDAADAADKKDDKISVAALQGALEKLIAADPSPPPGAATA